MTLPILWFIIIAVLISAYYVLDGFDLGAGILSPFVAKTPGEKRALMTSIGPVWDGNEVWLLTAGGALFAAFAPAYATVFSGFYLAIMLVLFGLIIRAVSLEFRAHDPKWQKFWDACFFVGSLVPALLFGVALGNCLQGVPLDAAGNYIGSFFGLLTPFPLLCGLLGLSTIILQGACWLAAKIEEGTDLHKRAVTARVVMQVVTAVLVVAVSIMFFNFVGFPPGEAPALPCSSVAFWSRPSSLAFWPRDATGTGWRSAPIPSSASRSSSRSCSPCSPISSFPRVPVRPLTCSPQLRALMDLR